MTVQERKRETRAMRNLLLLPAQAGQGVHHALHIVEQAAQVEGVRGIVHGTLRRSRSQAAVLLLL
jgi:hypothetical protein